MRRLNCYMLGFAIGIAAISVAEAAKPLASPGIASRSSEPRPAEKDSTTTCLKLVASLTDAQIERMYNNGGLRYAEFTAAQRMLLRRYTSLQTQEDAQLVTGLPEAQSRHPSEHAMLASSPRYNFHFVAEVNLAWEPPDDQKLAGFDVFDYTTGKAAGPESKSETSNNVKSTRLPRRNRFLAENVDGISASLKAQGSDHLTPAEAKELRHALPVLGRFPYPSRALFPIALFRCLYPLPFRALNEAQKTYLRTRMLVNNHDADFDHDRWTQAQLNASSLSFFKEIRLTVSGTQGDYGDHLWAR